MSWDPGPKYSAYIARIQEILSDEKRTVRDVYYALEARGFEDELRSKSYERALARHEENPDDHPHPDDVPEDEWCWQFEYRYVKRAVKKGRRHGYIDPALIVDAGRPPETTVDEGHGSPEQFIENHVEGVWNAYRENFWEDQPTYLEVWLEKQSLASVFRPITEEFNVRLEATRGDWSDSKVYEATQRLAEKLEAGKDVVVLYFGDFNPSGFHAPVAVQETMAYYGLDLGRDGGRDSLYFDIWPRDGPVRFGGCEGSLLFDRKAINLEHIERFDLPENPNPSSTDKDRELRERFQRHVSDGRDVNVELNALKEYHRDFLEDLIRDSISEHVDEQAREQTEERITRRRETLADAIQVDDSGLGGGSA